MADDPDFTLTPVDYDPWQQPATAPSFRQAVEHRQRRGMPPAGEKESPLERESGNALCPPRRQFFEGGKNDTRM
jgi:hypothetical protein